MKEFRWVGSEQDFIDQPKLDNLEQLVIGRYGGSSKAGQTKNEDGCLVWTDPDWEFVMILDAHTTAESAEVVLKQFAKYKTEIHALLYSSLKNDFFKSLEKLILSLFLDKEFLSICENVKGETSCLVVVRKENFVWWFSVGDCILYLFHPDLAKLGQYQLNQRQFFEWVGQVNTFQKKVPCYSSGTRELRKGSNHLFLTTDGIFEALSIPEIMNAENVQALLQQLKEYNTKDSTTIVSWKVENGKAGSMPTT